MGGFTGYAEQTLDLENSGRVTRTPPPTQSNPSPTAQVSQEGSPGHRPTIQRRSHLPTQPRPQRISQGPKSIINPMVANPAGFQAANLTPQDVSPLPPP